MSLSRDGFWKAGFWSTTFWADGFWYELPEEAAGGSGYPTVIIYETLPTKTIKRIIRRVRRYKKTSGAKDSKSPRPLSPEHVNAIVEALAEQWPKDEMQHQMQLYKIDERLALLSYKATLRQLINDDDLALLLIFASI